MPIRIARTLFVLMIAAGLYMMVRLSLPYLSMQPGIDFLLTKESAYRVMHWRASFYVHVFTSSFVLAAGLLQFIPVILRRYKRIHRFSGYVYTAGVMLVSGPSGLVMALYANGGVPARISFVLLALLWMLTTGLALWYAWRRKWALHGAWMARSYALTLSSLTLRSYALLLGLSHMDIKPAQRYILISWLSWTLNLVVAEVWIRKGGVKRLLSHRAPAESVRRPAVHLFP